MAVCEHFGRSRGVSSMMVGMLVAALGLVLAGLLAIGYGISVKEFSVGNTLILSGVIGVCTGVLMFGLWLAVRELKNIARRLGGGAPDARRSHGAAGASAGPHARARACWRCRFPVPIRRPPRAPAARSLPHRRRRRSPPPWQDEAARRALRRLTLRPAEAAAKAEAQPAVLLDLAQGARAGAGAHL